MKKNIVLIALIILILFLGGYLYKSINNKKYFLSIVAIMKNEKPYLKEWIEYHRLQGVEHFYLCDNESTDNSKEYLKPYIDKKLITYIYKPGKNQQLKCYSQVVDTYKNETTWLAIIDIDEYLVPLKANNIKSFLKDFNDVSEVSLHWMNYGDNNLFSRSEGLITETFTSHSKSLNHTVKSIVKPDKVVDFNSFGSNHYVKVHGPSVNEYHKPVSYMLNFNISGDLARVNQYILKSFEEFHHKKSRGHPEGTPIDYSYYFFHNKNDAKNDTSMLRFLPKLKKYMQKSPLKDVKIPKVDTLKNKNFDNFYFSSTDVKQILNRSVNKEMTYKEIQELYNKDVVSY